MTDAKTMQDKNSQTVKPSNRQTAPSGSPANPTAEAIVSRLPDRPLVNAREIADALFQTTTSFVVAAVDEGKLRAVKIGGQYRVARAEAARWIRSLGV